MKLDLKQLFDIVGEKRSIDCSLDFSEESLNGQTPFREPVKVTGQIENRAGVVRLVFGVKSALSLACDRCLEEIDREFDCTFEYVLVRELSNAEADTEEYVVCEDGMLDLAELVRTDFLLELPTKVLCREDCKGLCPQCGKNLNFETCECKKKSIDPRWEVLSEMFS